MMTSCRYHRMHCALILVSVSKVHSTKSTEKLSTFSTFSALPLNILDETGKVYLIKSWGKTAYILRDGVPGTSGVSFKR